MDLLVFIILFAPGLISLLISGVYKVEQKKDIITVVVLYGICVFLTIMITYVGLYIMLGHISIGWGDGTTINMDTNLNSVGTVVRIIGLQLVGSIIVGFCVRVYFHLIKILG